MKEGHAKRQVHVHVASHASFCFHQQPTIPFAGSAFENRMRIDLDDETSRFCMCEIFSCGRSARQEYFAYRFYHSLTEIYRQGTIIYRDNTRYDPALFDMGGMGMYESRTHLASLFLTGRKIPFRHSARSEPSWKSRKTQKAQLPYYPKEIWPSAFWAAVLSGWKS